MATEQVVHGPTEIKSQKMKVSAFWMFVVGVTMWAAVPIGWLKVAALVYGEQQRLGLALAVSMSGALISIVALVALLGKLNRSWNEEYERLNERRAKNTPLEPVLVISVMIALVIFAIYFFAFGSPTSTSGDRT